MAVGYGHVGIIHNESAVVYNGHRIQVAGKCRTVCKGPGDYLLSASAILQFFAESGADRRLAVPDVDVPGSAFRHQISVVEVQDLVVVLDREDCNFLTFNLRVREFN